MNRRPASVRVLQPGADSDGGLLDLRQPRDRAIADGDRSGVPGRPSIIIQGSAERSGPEAVPRISARSRVARGRMRHRADMTFSSRNNPPGDERAGTVPGPESGAIDAPRHGEDQCEDRPPGRPHALDRADGPGVCRLKRSPFRRRAGRAEDVSETRPGASGPSVTANALSNRRPQGKRRFTGRAPDICNQFARGLRHIRACRFFFERNKSLEEGFLLPQSGQAWRIAEKPQHLGDMRAVSPRIRFHNWRLRCQ
jgi:hypothetical protein